MAVTDAESQGRSLGAGGLTGWLMPAIFLMIVGASVGLRLALIEAFPTQPISDFSSIVSFSTAMANEGPTAGRQVFWSVFNGGTPTLLSAVLHIVGGDPVVTARMATAIMLGLLPLLPICMLRNALSPSARLLSGMLVAFFPALVIFSGVVAQDNWLMPPLLALACLAIRNCRIISAGGYPVWSAIFWCLAGFVRQEMFVVAFPIALLAAWPWNDSFRRLRVMSYFVCVSILLMLAIATQRYAATGDFSLTTRHAGLAMLGSYVPGVGFSWTHSQVYIASLKHDERDWRTRSEEDGVQLAFAEIAKRPAFHLIRRLGALFQTATGADGSLVSWSLTGPGTQSSETEARAERFSQQINPVIQIGLLLLHALFLAALPIAWRQRDPAMLAIGLVVALKVGIHFLIALQARFILSTVPLEILVVCISFGYVKWGNGSLRSYVIGMVAMTMMVISGWRILPAWSAWVASKEWDSVLPHYRFSFNTNHAMVECAQDLGRLLALTATGATIRPMQVDPPPGSIVAEARCRISYTQQQTAPLRLEVLDGYRPGNRPGNIVQEAVVDGRVLRSHDVGAEPGTGWWSIDLPETASNKHEIVVRILAGHPTPGASWGGTAASTEFRLSETAK